MKLEYQLTIKINDEKEIQIDGFGSGYKTNENAVKRVRQEINRTLTTYIKTGKIVHDE